MCFGGQHVTDVVSCPWDHSHVNIITRCYLNEMLQQVLYLVLQTTATEPLNYYYQALSLQCTQGPLLERTVKFDQIPNIFGFWKFIEYRILNIFSSWKMNEYEYRIVLFGPNYSNSSNSLRIIRSNTGRSSRFISRERESTREKSKRLTTTKKSL